MHKSGNAPRTFSEFYPYYLEEHRNTACRRLHFIGSSMVVAMLLFILFTASWALLLAVPVVGYTFAWVGHFVFEKNKPATFKYPVWSLMGDWVMFKDMLVGRVRW